MTPLTLKIRNFGSIESVDLNLANRGLTLILGYNEDAPKASSNGAAKSLLLEALVWCLWGKTVRKMDNDEVVRRAVGRDCSVSFHFEENGQQYTISRYLACKTDRKKPNDLVIEVNGEDQSLASMRETQASVDALIGVDFTTFCALMPGAGVKVSEMTDLSIKELLEKILQTELLGEAQEKAKIKAKVIESEILKLNLELQSMETQISSSSARILSWEAQSANFNADKQAKLTAAISLQEKLNGQLLTTTSQASSRSAHEEAIKQLNLQLSSFLIEIRDIQTVDNGIESKLANLLIQSRQQEAVQRDVIKRAQARKAKLTNLGPVCAACDQEVHESHLSPLLAELDKEIASCEASLLELSQAQSTWISTTASLRLPLQSQMKAIQAQYDATMQLVPAAQQQLKAAQQAEEEVNRLTWQLQQQVTEIARIEQLSNPLQDSLEQEKASMAEMLSKAKEAQETLKEKQLSLDNLTFWVKGFSAQGIRSYMLEHVTPVLNDRAKFYADILTDGEMKVSFHTQQTLKNGNTKEYFHVKVSQRNGGSSYESNSAGEKARANLAIALALGDLAALRVNKKIPFRFLDEPFESVDESGVEAILQLLNQQKENFDTVFVVTHQDHFKQLFTNQITMIKSNGVSRLEDNANN